MCTQQESCTQTYTKIIHTYIHRRRHAEGETYIQKEKTNKHGVIQKYIHRYRKIHRGTQIERHRQRDRHTKRHT